MSETRPAGGGGDLSRRRMLYLAGASILGVATARLLEPTPESPQAGGPPGAGSGDHHAGGHAPAGATTATPDASQDGVLGSTIRRWSDPATWKGKVPGPGDIARVIGNVLLDIDATVAGLIIPAGASLEFDAVRSRTLRSAGNVVVEGRLTMRPRRSSVLHRIVVTGAKESAFRGGGHVPLSTDAGVWVMGKGVLDIVGSSKRAWTRAAGTVANGSSRVTLAETPTGWQVGDEVVITPTGSPTSSSQYAAYDSATITRVSGRTISLSRSTRYEHPLVRVGSGKTFAAEVLNLTRNVRIEGTPKGRTHVFFHSMRKQTLRYTTIRYVGPRQGASGGSKGVLGRYGLHFHHIGSASSGTLVEGLVVRDAGDHAFVPHASHGVTFRNCIAHDVMEEAYWWDPGPGNATNGVLYDGCVASRVRSDPDSTAFRLSGFWLGHGTGNRARSCVSVGVVGSRSSSGFVWPEDPGGTRNSGIRSDEVGIWGFADCVAHNNKVNGIFVWQNNPGKTVVDEFVAYHNGRAGVEHGAYKNVYQYRDSILYGNGTAAVVLHAVAGAGSPSLSLDGVVCDGAGRSNYVLLTERHNLPAARPTLVRSCTFRGYQKAAFGLLNAKGGNPDQVDVVDCAFTANEFWLADTIPAGSVLRVQDPTHGSIELRRSDQPGEYRPEWNARVSPIASFA